MREPRILIVLVVAAALLFAPQVRQRKSPF